MIADSKIVAHDVRRLASTTGKTLSPNGGTSALACCSAQ
jgi:hypothetical protein